MRTFMLMSVLTGVVVLASNSILFDAPERFTHQVSQISAQMTQDVPVDETSTHVLANAASRFLGVEYSAIDLRKSTTLLQHFSTRLIFINQFFIFRSF